MSALGDASWRSLRRKARRLDLATLRELSPMLVLSPHPDDETLGCGGLLARMTHASLPVHVVYLTDGSASHPGSERWTPERLGARRRREAIAALRVLGLGEDQATFLDWPDASPHPAGSAAHEETLDRLRRLCARLGVRAIVGPWIGEAHCDHEAGARLCEALSDRLTPRPRRLSYFVWAWDDAELPRKVEDQALWALPCQDLVEPRRTALAQHASQLGGLVSDSPDPFRLPEALAALTSRPSEVFAEHP